MTFFLSMPNSKEKMELGQILIQMKSSNPNLKNILKQIQNKIDYAKSPMYLDVTLREKNIKIWNHVLDIFTLNIKK